MGSAITFFDKITNKNCQNLQDLGSGPLCTSSSFSCNSGNHSHCCCTYEHVDLSYCEHEGLGQNCLGEKTGKEQWEDVEEELSETEEEVSPRGKLWKILLTTLSRCIMGRRCLCDTIKPILKLSQLLGVIPLNLNHRRNSDHDEKPSSSCELTFRSSKSLSAFLNTSFILLFLLISPMIIVFRGTDLHAFSLQMLAMCLETIILLAVGRLYQGKFSKGWASLNSVFSAICYEDDFKQITFGSYITALIIVMEGIGFFIFMYWTSLGLYQSCSALLIGTFVVSLTLIIPYIMSTLFFFICLLIRNRFLKISEMLKTVVSKHNSNKLSSKIDALRVLHEQLCQTVTYFEDFFGFQVLLTMLCCCFTVTIAAYALVLKGESISSPEGMTGAWGIACFLYSIILISGRLVTNAAASPGPVLNAIPLCSLDEKSQTQVTAFLKYISAFPTKMSAGKIIFLLFAIATSAATNITTYLLVLMQFKLSVENRFDDDAENLTIPVAGFHEMDPSTEPIFYDIIENVTTLSSLLD